MEIIKTILIIIILSPKNVQLNLSILNVNPRDYIKYIKLLKCASEMIKICEERLEEIENSWRAQEKRLISTIDDNAEFRVNLLLILLLKTALDERLPVYFIGEEPDGIIKMKMQSVKLIGMIDKRFGRYHRKYPLKRPHENEYSRKHFCSPTRDELVKLLILMTEPRNKHKTINFCNRKIPAYRFLSNLRFI